MRLRDRREVSARRPSGQWRLAAAGGVLALIVGAACLAPLSPLSSRASGASSPADAAVMTPATVGGGAGAGGVQPHATTTSSTTSAATTATVLPKPTSTPAPTAIPTPVVIPTLTTGGLSVLDSVRSDRIAQWVRNTAETPLRSGPNPDASVFTTLPQWSLLKQIGTQPDWLLVQYSGDGDTRQAGPGWVKASDVGGVDSPGVWLTTSSPGGLWAAADASARNSVTCPTPR